MRGGRIRCPALLEPHYAWDRYGECWAYTDDPAWEIELARDVDKYKFYGAFYEGEVKHKTGKQ